MIHCRCDLTSIVVALTLVLPQPLPSLASSLAIFCQLLPWLLPSLFLFALSSLTLPCLAVTLFIPSLRYIKMLPTPTPIPLPPRTLY